MQISNRFQSKINSRAINDAIMDGLSQAFNSEINFRIETDSFFGFCFIIIDQTKFPRIWGDHDIDNQEGIRIESPEHVLLRNDPFLEKDWLDRVYGTNFEDACFEFFERIYKHYPRSKFADWYKMTISS